MTSASTFPSWASLPLSDTVLVVSSGAVIALVALWAATLVRARRRPAVPSWLAVAVATLLAWGAWLVVNADGHYDDRTSVVVTRTPFVAWLPGGIDRATGALAWLQTAAVLLGGLALADLARRERVRAVVLWSLAAAGGVVGWLGALDRAGIGPLRFRQLPLSGTHFAMFEYHANAAAFLDLTLPAALVSCWRAWRDPVGSRSRTRRRAAAVVATAGTLVGCAAHVSKAGQALTFVTLVGTLVAAWSAVRVATPRARSPLRWIAAAAFVIAVAAAGVVGASERWRALPAALHADSPRVLMMRVGLHAAARAPLAGSGPGSFELLVPTMVADHVPALYAHWIVQPYHRGTPTTIWMRAHNDALQTLVEWGAIGLALAAAVFIAPIVGGVRALRRRASADTAATLAGVGALTIVGLHSVVDFPLQVLPIQLAAAAWGALVLGATRLDSASREDDHRWRALDLSPSLD